MNEMWTSTKAWAVDTADRTFWTFIQAWGGLATAASFNLIDLGSWKAAAVASLPAAYAVIKGSVAKFVNDPDTATFLKRRTTP